MKHSSFSQYFKKFLFGAAAVLLLTFLVNPAQDFQDSAGAQSWFSIWGSGAQNDSGSWYDNNSYDNNDPGIQAQGEASHTCYIQRNESISSACADSDIEIVGKGSSHYLVRVPRRSDRSYTKIDVGYTGAIDNTNSTARIEYEFRLADNQAYGGLLKYELWARALDYANPRVRIVVRHGSDWTPNPTAGIVNHQGDLVSGGVFYLEPTTRYSFQKLKEIYASDPVADSDPKLRLKQ